MNANKRHKETEPKSKMTAKKITQKKRKILKVAMKRSLQDKMVIDKQESLE
jgi:hypothetical protein